MEEYAKQYYRANQVTMPTKVTSYSFEVEDLPNKKDEKPKKYTVMLSWFFEPKGSL